MKSSRHWLAALLCALLAGGCAPRSAPGGAPQTVAGGLAGTSWRLVEFRSSSDAIGTLRPQAGREYILELGADGRVAMRLDCNRAGGTWTHAPSGPASGTLGFGTLAMTRAFCGEGALDTRIARDAEFVRTYLLRDGRLYLDLMADAGTYVWEAQ